MKRLIFLVVAMAVALLAAVPAFAHEVRPAYLQIDEQTPSHFEIVWKQPVMGDMAIRLVPHLSNGWLERPADDEFVTNAYRIRTWRVTALGAAPLAGRTVSVKGLDRTITDAIVRVQLADGRGFDTMLKPDESSLPLTFEHTGGLAVPAYFQLGVMHILTGVDHLMFVLGLLLLIGIRWRLLKAITAFTVAHSITLGASAIGLVHVPSTVIECLVALSIVFVAAELAHRDNGATSLTIRYPWLIAFVFGLLHGFAFAGALAEVGLPKDAIPASLFLFNLGVEAGQLMFVGAAILTILALRLIRVWLPALWASFAVRIPPYAAGGFAAFWFIERTVAAFS